MDSSRSLQFEDPDTSRRQQGINYLLVIGIDRYTASPPLQNAVRDSKAVVEVLTQRYTFEQAHTTELYDTQATRKNIIRALDALVAKVTKNDNVLIYFAGHGYYYKALRRGYLVPVDAPNADHTEMISNSVVRDYIQGISSHHTFLVVDSCFSGSLMRDAGPTTVLADKVDRFSSRWGLAAGMIEKVADGYVGDHSPFARSFIEYLKKNEALRLPVSELIQYVSKVTTYNSDQTPVGGVLHKTDDLGGQFVFDLQVSKSEEVHKTDPLAKEQIEKRVPVASNLILDIPFTEMVLVEGNDEIKTFEIGKYPVTQALWEAVMEENPAHCKGENLPVESVSWNDCQAFIKRLNAKTGLTYRLPTDAEWEYAAKGGNQSKGYKFAGGNELDKVAWYWKNAEERPHPVGTKAPNELNIYDMSGNVREWCEDWYDEDQDTKVVRGGSWYDFDTYIFRPSCHDYLHPSFRYDGFGFRLSRYR